MEKMDMLISLVALMGVGYGVFRGLKWMIKAGQIQSGKNAPLSPSDLRVLETSAARLMEDLRAVTDDCVLRIERACAEAQACLELMENHGALNKGFDRLPASPTPSVGEWTAPVSPALSLDSIETAVSIARDTGMTTGEIELLRGLRAIETRN